MLHLFFQERDIPVKKINKEYITEQNVQFSFKEL